MLILKRMNVGYIMRICHRSLSGGCFVPKMPIDNIFDMFSQELSFNVFRNDCSLILLFNLRNVSSPMQTDSGVS